MGPAVPDLRDEHVVLRPPTLGDVDAMTEACQDPEIPRFTRVPAPYTRDHAIAHVAAVAAGWEDGSEAGFVVTDARTGTLLGAVSVMRLAAGNATAEIGYWVGAEARGRGVATRAVRLLSAWALHELGVERLELVADVRNLASQRVAERAGFTREGVLRSWPVRPGHRADVVLFSRLPSDPPVG